MDVLMKKLDPRAQLPLKGTAGSAGFDLCALLDEAIVLQPGERRLVGTGLSAAIPEGMVGLVFARSGLATRRGLAMSNGVGVVDSDYRGEFLTPLINLSDTPQEILPGERIAQLVIMPVPPVRFVEAETLPESGRGANGFGSTGRLD